MLRRLERLPRFWGHRSPIGVVPWHKKKNHQTFDHTKHVWHKPDSWNSLVTTLATPSGDDLASMFQLNSMLLGLVLKLAAVGHSWVVSKHNPEDTYFGEVAQGAAPCVGEVTIPRSYHVVEGIVGVGATTRSRYRDPADNQFHGRSRFRLLKTRVRDGRDLGLERTELTRGFGQTGWTRAYCLT